MSFSPTLDHTAPGTGAGKIVYPSNLFNSGAGSLGVANTSTAAVYTLDGSNGYFFYEGSQSNTLTVGIGGSITSNTSSVTAYSSATSVGSGTVTTSGTMTATPASGSYVSVGGTNCSGNGAVQISTDGGSTWSTTIASASASSTQGTGSGSTSAVSFSVPTSCNLSNIQWRIFVGGGGQSGFSATYFAPNNMTLSW